MRDRRQFIQQALTLTSGLHFLRHQANLFSPSPRPMFEISLAQWSLHRSLFSGRIQPLNFPKIAKNEFGISAVEYVNAFFLPSQTFVDEMKTRAEGEGVRSLLIMVDDAGRLGDPNEALRLNAVDRHTMWLDFAASLGCHSIRVNARSDGSREEQMHLMADGLRRLCERANERGLNVLIENHGGYSSHGDWVAGLMEATDHPRAGTLPDFGNWNPDDEWGAPQPGVAGYDRYKGVNEVMPYTKGSVSAKSYDFADDGRETLVDYARMIEIVGRHGFEGHIGIEYEGQRLSEHNGILATKALLEQLRGE